MIHIDVEHPFQDYTFKAQLEIPSKGIISIFGPSGAGKTTLLNFISGKLSPKKGIITINGKTILDTSKKIALPIHQRGIGYVFQDPTLFPHYSVEKNLLYGAKEKNPPLFHDITKLLGIEPLLKKRIAYLSGGEKQRIAIGRALLSSPDILLMDEPLSALDQNRKEEILSYLEEATILELNDLVKAIEDKFGVVAAAVAAAPAAAEAAVDEGPTEVTVTLTSFG